MTISFRPPTRNWQDKSKADHQISLYVWTLLDVQQYPSIVRGHGWTVTDTSNPLVWNQIWGRPREALMVHPTHCQLDHVSPKSTPSTHLFLLSVRTHHLKIWGYSWRVCNSYAQYILVRPPTTPNMGRPIKENQSARERVSVSGFRKVSVASHPDLGSFQAVFFFSFTTFFVLIFFPFVELFSFNFLHFHFIFLF